MIFNVGHVIGDNYRIIDQVGEGGFGEVYKAEELKSHKTIAIKCLLPQLSEDIPDYVSLFKREAHAAQQISDDNVVKIFSIEETTERNSVTNFIRQLPNKLSRMIMKMIEKKPENRFINADDILSYLGKLSVSEEKPLNDGIKEIAGLMHTAEDAIRKREIAGDQKRKQEMEEVAKKNSLLSFGCDEILKQFDQLIDQVNAEASTVKIGKRPLKTISRYEQEYSFHGKSIKIMLERTDAIGNLPNIIAWGYCYIDQYKDGFNLLLQLDPREVYPKWLIIITRDNPLTRNAQHTDPHAMIDVPRLDDALMALHALHIYVAERKPFSLDDFILLVRKLVSS